MALEIKAIPTLHGEAAERFLRLAEASILFFLVVIIFAE